MGSFIAGTQSWYLGQNKFGCQGVGLGPNFHITPQGTRDNDDLKTTCKISHGYNQVDTQASCFMVLWYYGWEFTQTDPTFPSYVLSSFRWIHPSLSRFIPENTLLASVPCFQKIRLLFTNDLYFLTITCRPSRSFFLFTFCFIFLYMFTKTIHCDPLWGKPFFVHLYFYTWQTFSVHALELFLFTSHGLYTNPIYIQRFFLFFPTRTYGSHKSFFIYTRCSHTQEFLSMHHLHTKTFYTHFPFSLYTHTFYSQHFFLFIMILFLGQRS